MPTRPFMPRKYREMNQWDRTRKINDDLAPIAFRAGESVLRLSSHSISGTVYPDDRGIYGYLIVKYAGTTYELVTILFRPNDNDPELHDVLVEHDPDHKAYREDGSVSSWASREMFAARRMSDVLFTVRLASCANSVGTASFFKYLFQEIARRAPYVEQDDSLVKKASRFYDKYIVPLLK